MESAEIKYKSIVNLVNKILEKHFPNIEKNVCTQSFKDPNKPGSGGTCL